MGSLPDQLAGLHAAVSRPRRTAARLAQLQSERLRRLVRHACDTVPGYRDRVLAGGGRPEATRTVGDLSRLPLTNREELAGRPEVRQGRLVTVRTSGSSGVPLVIRYRPGDATELNSTWLRPLLAHGIRPWHSRLEITGPHNFPAGRPAYERLGLWRRRCISVFEEPGAWLAAARAARADYLWGYSGSLRLFAQHVLDGGHEAPPFRAVFGVSDLVDPECRALVREAFGRPLVDVYGSAEAGCVAWQCPTCDGYHVNVDTVIVEILDGDGPAAPGVAGRVVVTNLLSFAMPIIRYEQGDVAAMSPRPPTCGRGLPLMEVVEGRANAFVRLPSGRMLSPMYFFGLMKRFEDGLRAWRVIQESDGRLSVLVVPARPDLETASLAEGIRRALAEPVEIGAAAVRELPAEPSGKARAVFSRLASEPRG